MMKRRDFLQATLVTAAGSALVPACTSDDTQPVAACSGVDGAAYFPQSVASGDPKPDSVILWTRVEDPEVVGQDLPVNLRVALDPEMTNVVVDIDGVAIQSLIAEAAFDHCVKVKLAGLEPATTYYYRFSYAKAGTCNWSHVGQTKTAPGIDDDAPLRFAYASCQDFIGRYYNAYAAMAQEELDFFVHLGDYIYETTGDPTFQTATEERKISFTDTAGAIQFMTSDGQPYYAAQSLDNYRELYRTYRSDPALQLVHEKFAMIAVWDDHEYSNDCHGATATYFNDKQDELNVDRRKNANKAWFEYMPVDYPAGDDFRYDESANYPNDIRIHRDFTFGKNVHLIMTDLRTYRSDHLIPEGAFPGRVIVTEEELMAAFMNIPQYAGPYFDISTLINNVDYQLILSSNADMFGYNPADITGNISAVFVNQIVAAINQAQMPPIPYPLIADLDLMAMKHGIAYIDFGKSGLNTSIGSRYFVVKDLFDPYAQLLYASTAASSETVMGTDQEPWFLETMQTSDRTWKVWGNEYCLMPLAVDLRTRPELQQYPQYQRQFYMNVDAWDGFQNRRSALLEQLSGIGNVVAITGDIHAFYAATPMANGDPTKKIVEFVGSSITSNTFKEELLSQVKEDPTLSQISAAESLAGFIDILLKNPINPHLGYARSDMNGFCVVEANSAEFVVTMHQIPSAEVANNYESNYGALAPKIKTVRFKAVTGENDLYMDENGTWKKWDPATQMWV